MFKTELRTLVHDVQGNSTDQPYRIYRPVARYYFYDILLFADEMLNEALPASNCFDQRIHAFPEKFIEITNYNLFKTNQKLKIYKPIAPTGYVALGYVVAENEQSIPSNYICLHHSLCQETDNSQVDIFNPYFKNFKITRSYQYNFAMDEVVKCIEIDYINNNIDVYQVAQIFKTQTRPPSGLGTTLADKTSRKTIEVVAEAKEEDKKKEEPSQLEINQKNDSLHKFSLPVCNPAKIDKDLVTTLLFDEAVGRDNMSDIKVLQNYQLLATQLANAEIYQLDLDLQHTFSYLQPALAYELVGVSSLTHPLPDLLPDIQTHETLQEPTNDQNTRNLGGETEQPKARVTSSPSKMDLLDLQLQEEYLYVFRPIAPPGFVSMGIVCSTQPMFEGVAYCVHEKLIHFSKKSQPLGEVFGQSTAHFIQQFAQLCMDQFETKEEKQRKLRSLDLPDKSMVELELCRESGFINIKSDVGYPVISASVFILGASDVYISQRSVVRGTKLSQEGELVCEVLLDRIENTNQRILQVFRPILKKETHSYLEYSYKIIYIDGPQPLPDVVDQKEKKDPKKQAVVAEVKVNKANFDWSFQIQQLQQIQQANQPAKDTKKQSVTSADAEKVIEVKQMKTKYQLQFGQNSQNISLPAELGLYHSDMILSAYAFSTPLSYEVLYQSKTTLNEDFFILKLVCPEGFQALSDVVCVGDINKFDLSKHLCVCVSFLQELSLKPSVFDKCGYFCVNPFPLSTDLFNDDGRKLLNFRDGVSHEQLKTYWIKDSLFQTYMTSISKKDDLKFSKFIEFEKSRLETKLLLRNVLEISTDDLKVNDQFKIITCNDPHLLAFGSQLFAKPEVDDVAFVQRSYVVSQFKDGFSNNAIFAKPIGVKKLQGTISAKNCIYNCYELIPPKGYVALGSVMSQQAPKLENFSCFHQDFVDFVVLHNPEFVLEGYQHTDGLWVYQKAENELFHCFDHPVSRICIPFLRQTIVDALNSESYGGNYSPSLISNQQHKIAPYLQYLQSYCISNKVSLHSQSIFDHGMYSFDASIVTDPQILKFESQLVSLGSLRVFCTNQILKKEHLTALASKGNKSRMKKKEVSDFSIPQLQEKLSCIQDLICLLEQIGIIKDVIAYGRPSFYSMPCIIDGQKHYQLISDKLPVLPTGLCFYPDKPLYFSLLLKHFAMQAGGYTPLLSKTFREIVELVLSIYGFNVEDSKTVFTLYLLQSGNISFFKQDESDQLLMVSVK